MDTQPQFPQRREFTRVRHAITALVTTDGDIRPMMVRDLCLDGIGVRADTPLREGAPCTVELRRDDAPDERWITAHGTVARAADDVVGIHFLDLQGVDSLNHLRALIMYHAEDPDHVMAEFDAHWGLLPK